MNLINNLKFRILIQNEQSKFETTIIKLVQEGMSNKLTHAIRELANKNPALIQKLGGQTTILNILKNKKTDEHSNIIKECIIKSLSHHNHENIIRSALKKCIEAQYSEAQGWKHVPIRFYREYRDNTPYLKDNMLYTGKSHERQDWNQINASWLWSDKCIYLWHRWSNNEQDALDIQTELEYLEDTKYISQSLYKDKQALVLCLIHGEKLDNIKVPNNINLIINPWNINTEMEKITTEKNPVSLNTGFK